MAYTREEGLERIREEVAGATAEIGTALSAVGEAHELLDEHLAQRLESELFRPLQRAYAIAQRTCSELGTDDVATGIPPRGAPAHGAKGFVEDGVQAAERADALLAGLQDSMLPVEVGDATLRSHLSTIRELLSGVRPAARELVRVLGR